MEKHDKTQGLPDEISNIQKHLKNLPMLDMTTGLPSKEKVFTEEEIKAWEEADKKAKAEDPEAIHNWFGLTYANYLVIPRSALQSMPPEWQRQFVALLEEMEETLDLSDRPEDYWIRATKDGKFIHDPLGDYQRGRRRIPYRKNEA